ncbi:MAG: DUF362 domain-containing protein [Bryobacteraceae bacterium]|nr:DUF362 domain-containing protein [Bryobacteraceae bacterium]
MTRRELLALGAAVPILKAAPAPAAPVSIVRCRTYTNDELLASMKTLFDQLGGLPRLVRNKTVTVKLNLTGSPALKFQGRALGVTHYSHPNMVAAFAHLAHEAGARRVRFVESAWGTAGPLEEYMLDSGWNVRRLSAVAPNIEYENTNALGKGKRYSRLKTAGGGYIYPVIDFNHSYEDTDCFVSMAKLKNHATCGITLAMKNCFGNTPASIYGDDAGVDAPNESPTSGRVNTCHLGKRQPAKSSPGELDPTSSREPGYRMPRITVDVVSARPIDLSIIDGIETVTGGEGPWIKGLKHVTPHVLLAGTNMVCTDAVGTAVMGYDPRAARGVKPFIDCDNMLTLAEARGLGTADLARIEVAGLPIAEARYAFP